VPYRTGAPAVPYRRAATGDPDGGGRTMWAIAGRGDNLPFPETMAL